MFCLELFYSLKFYKKYQQDLHNFYDKQTKKFKMISIFASLLSSAETYVIVTFLTVSILAILKIFKAFKSSKTQKTSLNPSNSQYLPEQNRINSLVAILRYLKNFNEDMIISYSTYKQLLYLKTFMYHGTNLTSIFVMLNKQKSNDQIVNNQSFQDKLLEVLRSQIKQKITELLTKVSGLFQILQKGNIQFNKQKIKQFTNDHHINNLQKSNVSDLFRYNIALREWRNNLETKTRQLQESIQKQQQHLDDQIFINDLKNSLCLCSETNRLLHYIRRSFTSIQMPIQQLKNKTCENPQTRLQKIYQKLSEILDKSKTSQKIVNSRQNNQKQCLQFQNLIKSFLLDKTEKIFEKEGLSLYRNNPIKFYDEQITSLEKLSEQIKILKSKIQISNNQKPSNKSNQIQIYDTPDLPYNSQQKKQPSSLQTQTVKQENPRLTLDTFSPSKRMAFIKELDKTMVRNRIRKQHEQMQRMIKQQQEKMLREAGIVLAEGSNEVILEKL